MVEIPKPVLKVYQGERVLQEICLEGDREYIAGRTPQADIVVAHASVSRMHAKIYRRADGVYLEDLGSANGTYVNQNRVIGTVKLEDGQVIQLGQKTVHDPVRLVFEDPASRLLREMGLEGSASKSITVETPAIPEQEQEIPSQETTPQAPKVRPREELKIEGQTVAEEPSEISSVSKPMGLRIFKNPIVIGGGLLALVLVVLIIFWLVRTFRPIPTLWKSVQIQPPEIVPNGEVILNSPDIMPKETYTLLVNGVPANKVVVHHGRLSAQVPDLRIQIAGRHDAIVSVKLGEIEVFQGMVKYLITPHIDDVQPRKTVVGDHVTLTGTGFRPNKDQVLVKIGELPATVLEATPQILRVRIPVVTRERPVHVTADVEIEDWGYVTPFTLEVGPRIPHPLEFIFTAGWSESYKMWEIRHPVGVAFYVPGPVAAEGEIPKSIADVTQKLTNVFKRASGEPDLMFKLQRSGDTYRLGFQSRNTTFREIVSWTPEVLAKMIPEDRKDVMPEMLPYWTVGVLNRLLNTFVRGISAEQEENQPDSLQIFQRLRQANLDGGGQGIPEEQELNLLTPSEKSLLEHLTLNPPQGYGIISGMWEGTLDNIFFTSLHDLNMTMSVNLNQDGPRLRGEVRITIGSEKMKISVEPTTLQGEMQPGTPITVSMDARFNAPVGKIHFQGSVTEDTMQGEFTRLPEGKEGKWRMTRKKPT